MTDTYTPPDALVERVAKAIYDNDMQRAVRSGYSKGLEWSEYPNNARKLWLRQTARAALSGLPLGEIVEALRFYGDAWDGQEAKTMPWGEVQEAWSEPKESLLVDAGSEARRLRKQLEGGVSDGR